MKNPLLEDSEQSRRTMLRHLTMLAALAPAMLDAADRGNGKTEGAPAAVHGGEYTALLKGGSERIGILVYPEFTALDALGPHYALAGMMGAQVWFVAKTAEIVPTEGSSKSGIRILPHKTFADCPRDLDLLLVPGGLTGTMKAIQDQDTLHFIKECAVHTKLIGSVCTGSLILGAAGLLKGRKATSHWQTIDLLSEVGARPVHERIVFDGNDRVTAAGVSAGLDLGLELVKRYRGDFYCQGIQLLGEYDPQPPFPRGGNPKTAEKSVVDMLQGMHAPIVEHFREHLRQAQR